MKKRQDSSVPEGFTVSMAVVDTLPVLFFSGSACVLSARFPSALFKTGVIFIILAGAMKAAWKFIIAIAHQNIIFFNKQMRYLMPLGFLLAALALIINKGKWSFGAVWAHLISFPSIIFFLIGTFGIICMSVYPHKFSGMDPRANWIEQWTNTLAQASFFLAILL